MNSKNFLRISLFIFVVAGVSFVPMQANWLAKMNAAIAPAQKNLLSKARTILRKCTPKKITVSPDSFIGRSIRRKHLSDYVDACKGLESRNITKEELQNFTCPKNASPCKSIEDNLEWVMDVSSDVDSGIFSEYTGKTEVTSIACQECKLFLRYSDNYERTNKITNGTWISAVDAEGKTVDDQEQPKQEQIATPVVQTAETETKALPVTSMPAKGFYARVKAMMFGKR